VPGPAEDPNASREVAVDRTELAERAAALQWYHSLDLGQGVKTQGIYEPAKHLHRYAIPERLDGKTVLDIGAWDGFYSFEAERRGAKRVLATDHYQWDGTGWGSKQAFELAREAYGSHVEDRPLDVMKLSRAEYGTFDVVFFLGVLYHLKHPLYALERIFEVTDELLILETEIDMTWTRRPAAAFYPGRELQKIDSNWWGPNITAVEGMLRTVGFTDVRMVFTRGLPTRVARGLRAKFMVREKVALRHLVQRDRAVFHARK
jgi:tRNA (mo5U34)-methyltransferase